MHDLFITPLQFGGGGGDVVIYSFWNAGVYVDYNFLYLDMSHTATEASRKADLISSYTAYATTNGYSLSRVLGMDLIGSDPVTHIADAPSNASTSLPTNFTALSALLGLANGLNDSNTAQNDLATKYNSLAVKFNSVLDSLESQGIILP